MSTLKPSDEVVLVPIDRPTALENETAMAVPGQDLFTNYVCYVPLHTYTFTRLEMRFWRARSLMQTAFFVLNEGAKRSHHTGKDRLGALEGGVGESRGAISTSCRQTRTGRGFVEGKQSLHMQFQAFSFLTLLAMLRLADKSLEREHPYHPSEREGQSDYRRPDTFDVPVPERLDRARQGVHETVLDDDAPEVDAQRRGERAARRRQADAVGE